MKMLPKEETVSKDHRIKGGAFGFSDTDPFSERRDLTKESTYSAYDEGWIVAQDQARYDAIFAKLNPNPEGKITGMCDSLKTTTCTYSSNFTTRLSCTHVCK